MKKNILIIGLAGILGIFSGLTSCSPDYETDFNVLTLIVPDKSQAAVVFPLNGGNHEIEVKTNVSLNDWTAESNAEWCKVMKEDKKVIVSADDNNIYTQRQAEITIAYGHQSYSIIVRQFGLEPIILIGEEMLSQGYMKEVDPKLTTLNIPVSTNLVLDNIIVPDSCDWIRLSEQPESLMSKTRADNVNKGNLKFTLEQNTDTVVRYCTVILQSSQNYSYTNTFVIKQQKRGYIIEIDESKKNFSLAAAGGMITVPFNVNGPKKAYTYEIEESAKEWIIPVPATRAMREAYESFNIQTNIDTENVRVGHIVFKSTDKNQPSEFTVTVTQAKFVAVPPLCVENATATAGAGFITLKWSIPENKDYTSIKITYYDKVFTQNKEIEIKDNAATSYVVENTYQCAGEYAFTITTYGPTGMATEHPLVVKGISNESPRKIPVNLTVDMVTANATQGGDGQGIPGLIDGDKNTFYHTLWSTLSPNSQPHYVQFNLKNSPLQNFRFEYDARNNNVNNGGDVTRVGIWVSNTGTDGSFLKIGTETFVLPTTQGGHSEPNDDIRADISYKYIRFIPEARRNKDPLNATNTTDSWWNMGNIYLYKINYQDELWAKKELGN